MLRPIKYQTLEKIFWPLGVTIIYLSVRYFTINFHNSKKFYF